jgi:hypothetical protein
MTASSEDLTGKKVRGKATTHVVAHRNSIAGLKCYIQVGRRHTHQSMLFLTSSGVLLHARMSKCLPCRSYQWESMERLEFPEGGTW